ncbi:ABC transporter permease [Nesterenkonia sp. MY13]|uniref:Transport permease protein n=1 Tax=Nesterenkonia sedimenti TaxID=1463632 RepID=A0A7X8TL37_9MICC|nr:ABC transporter permease [Nesterenkonia sedimenti]NLS10579.1 ABC transporter permease [Nesterenkonia sedimenti]
MSAVTVKVRKPGLKAWLRLIQAEAKMVIRDYAGLIVPLGLPLLILVMQGISIDEMDQELAEGVTVFSYYALPVVISMVVATIAVINMPSFLATYRKTKLLRRLAVTPASPAMVLIAQMVVSFIQVILGIGLAFAVALLFFGADLPLSLWVALAVLLATCAAMYGLGMIVASVAPTPNSSVAIGLVAFFGIAALGGMFGPADNLPDTLQTIGAWLPFGAAVEAFQAAWVGETVEAQNWVVLGGSAVVGAGVAAVLFRWE